VALDHDTVKAKPESGKRPISRSAYWREKTVPAGAKAGRTVYMSGSNRKLIELQAPSCVPAMQDHE
jgi:hypothetical protein